MGLSIGAVKLYLELWQRGIFQNIKSVVDVGSQELHLSQADFEGLLSMAGLDNYEKEDFCHLTNWPGKPRCSVKPFYKALGVKEYACIDYGKDHEAIPLDLNAPLTDESLCGKFDLITDHGCAEHVFNIGEVYRTMHRLCKPEGLIIVYQAVWGGNGYYLFDSSFFEGLAAVNDYEILFSSYGIDSSEATTKNGGRNEYHVPLSHDLLKMVDFSKLASLSICYVFRKQSDCDFRYPSQGMPDSTEVNRQGYPFQFLPEPPTRSYVPASGSGLEITKTKDLVKHLTGRLSGNLLKRKNTEHDT